jgi:hypothetical protein
MKIRLAAIAKDEAAYLPEWIFHHLHFGFDDIEVVVNNTHDNSVTILEKIAAHYPVKFCDIGDTATDSPTSLQRSTYLELLKRARHDGVTHLMFLDIDEFWTPRDFQESIRDALVHWPSANVVSFQWALKCCETIPFGAPFGPANAIVWNRHVKSIFQTQLRLSFIGAHNVRGPEVRNVLANGRVLDPSNQALIDTHPLFLNLGRPQPYFVIHRIWRSPMEYVAILGQGLRQQANDNQLAADDPEREARQRIKANRFGYGHVATFFHRSYRPPLARLHPYQDGFEAFLQRCELPEELQRARESVARRARDTAQALRQYVQQGIPFVRKAVRGVKLSQF